MRREGDDEAQHEAEEASEMRVVLEELLILIEHLQLLHGVNLSSIRPRSSYGSFSALRARSFPNGLPTRTATG